MSDPSESMGTSLSSPNLIKGGSVFLSFRTWFVLIYFCFCFLLFRFLFLLFSCRRCFLGGAGTPITAICCFFVCLEIVSIGFLLGTRFDGVFDGFSLLPRVESNI